MPQSPQWQPIPRYMGQPDVGRFFSVIDSPRDRALFCLIYLYGLRVSEVGLLYVGDVDLVRERIVIKRVKGGVWSERPLFESASSLLRSYCDLKLRNANEPLFTGKAGPLKKRRIQTLFSIYKKAACLSPNFTCHSLRHSIATHLLDHGVPLEFVQDHLGHRNIQSTTIYARITSQHRAKVFRGLEDSPWIVHPGHLGKATNY